MLVVGQRGADSRLQRWSLAARLASQAPVPVAIIRAVDTRDRIGVIVGVDGSQSSMEASLLPPKKHVVGTSRYTPCTRGPGTTDLRIIDKF